MMEEGRWKWVVFLDEAVGRIREEIEYLNQRIWTSLAAVVVLVLFLLDQLERTKLGAEELRSLASVLVGCLSIYLLQDSIRAGFKAFRIYTVATPAVDTFVRRIAPVMLGLSLALASAMVLAIIATDLGPQDAVRFWFWNLLPLLLFSLFAASNVVGLLLFYRNPVRVFRGLGKAFSASETAGKASVAFVVLVMVYAVVRYLGGGILEVTALRPAWADFLKLAGGVLALYVFQIWLGSLLLDRNRSRRVSERVHGLRVRTASGDLDEQATEQEYVLILSEEMVPRELVAMFEGKN